MGDGLGEGIEEQSYLSDKINYQPLGDKGVKSWVCDLMSDNPSINKKKLEEHAWNRSWFRHFAVPIFSKSAVNFASGAASGAAAGAAGGAVAGAAAGALVGGFASLCTQILYQETSKHYSYQYHFIYKFLNNFQNLKEELKSNKHYETEGSKELEELEQLYEETGIEESLSQKNLERLIEYSNYYAYSKLTNLTKTVGLAVSAASGAVHGVLATESVSDFISDRIGDATHLGGENLDLATQFSEGVAASQSGLLARKVLVKGENSYTVEALSTLGGVMLSGALCHGADHFLLTNWQTKIQDGLDDIPLDRRRHFLDLLQISKVSDVSGLFDESNDTPLNSFTIGDLEKIDEALVQFSKCSFQHAHMHWNELEKQYSDYTSGFVKWMDDHHKDFKLHYKSQEDGAVPEGKVLTPNDFGAPHGNNVNEDSPYGTGLYEYLEGYKDTLDGDNNNYSSANINHLRFFDYISVAAFIASCTALYSCSTSKQGTDATAADAAPASSSVGDTGTRDVYAAADGTDAGATDAGGTDATAADATPTPHTDKNKITNGDIKNAFMMSNGEHRVRYYSIGNKFEESHVSDASEAITNDFKKLKDNAGVILSSKVAAAEGNRNEKTISIVINKKQSEIGDILFRDARFNGLDKSNKFYFKLSYKEGSPTLKIMRNRQEINFDTLELDEKKIFNSIKFNIIVKEGEKEKECNFQASAKLSKGSFNCQELADNENVISRKSEELSRFVKTKNPQVKDINPKSPSSDPNLPGSASRDVQGHSK
jgi:hypothetical protein